MLACEVDKVDSIPELHATEDEGRTDGMEDIIVIEVGPKLPSSTVLGLTESVGV